jgi:methylenetetrahydrofolate--tRNA-(uracil-5-)-methyltransferase
VQHGIPWRSPGSEFQSPPGERVHLLCMRPMPARTTIVGAGLAGCEAAWQLAERGVDVTLLEQKPERRTPAQTTDNLCELVCSNSMRGAALVNAVGLLKEELRRAGSLILACAEATKVPAGGALAVDREAFSRLVTEKIHEHPRIRCEAAVVDAIPDATADHPVILATGPLTGDALASRPGARRSAAKHLAYYDAIAPIVATDSIDMARVFRQSRWGKGSEASDDGERDATALGDEAYINCPFDEAGYRAFVQAIVAAEKVVPRSFEDVRYFEGCLPIEVMADARRDDARVRPDEAGRPHRPARQGGVRSPSSSSARKTRRRPRTTSSASRPV